MRTVFQALIPLFFLTASMSPVAAHAGKQPKEEVLSSSPRIVVYRHFLSDKECDHIIKLAKPRLERSTVVSNTSSKGEVDDRRTSYGMFFPYKLEDSIINKIEERIAALTSIPKENGENIQVLQYGLGGEYKPHYDYFDPMTSGGKHHLARGGQRVASFLMYLNTPKEGGETIFPLLKLKVQPRKGDALLFYSCDPDGRENPLTLHGGAPVLGGEKWLATKWLRMGRFE